MQLHLFQALESGIQSSSRKYSEVATKTKVAIGKGWGQKLGNDAHELEEKFDTAEDRLAFFDCRFVHRFSKLSTEFPLEYRPLFDDA